MNPAFLRIHHTIQASRTNGPGERYVIWCQGCTLACPGCFNPDTHPQHGGTNKSIITLLDEILSLASRLEGITISGGEPFQQPEALRNLLERLRAQSTLSVLIFTGYHRRELENIPHSKEIIAMTDVLIAGRYVQQKRVAKGLIGSSNKEVVFNTPKYSREQFESLLESEVMIDQDGSIEVTGIDPLQWHR